MALSTISMMRRAFVSIARSSVRPTVVTVTRGSHGHKETEAEFDARYENFFNKPDIDGWEIRKAINDMQGMDLCPEPKIIIAALKACRRNNDYALCVRILECIRDKPGPRKNEVWPYIKQELTPTMKELGILFPEEMGYDKPELAIENVDDM